jgi:hypothetical protein
MNGALKKSKKNLGQSSDPLKLQLFEYAGMSGESDRFAAFIRVLEEGCDHTIAQDVSVDEYQAALSLVDGADLAVHILRNPSEFSPKVFHLVCGYLNSKFSHRGVAAFPSPDHSVGYLHSLLDLWMGVIFSEDPQDRVLGLFCATALSGSTGSAAGRSPSDRG